MNSGKITLAVAIVIAILGGALFARSAYAFQPPTFPDLCDIIPHLCEDDDDDKPRYRRVWGEWGEDEYTECTGDCDSHEGTRIHTQTRECKRVRVEGENGYHEDECKRGETQMRERQERCRIEDPVACEPEPTPTIEITPEATPSVQPTRTPQREESKPEGCTQNCGVPECTAEKPDQPANFHVYRNGDSAILKWWATGGNKVNIYYKQSGLENFQYSVIGVDNTGYYEIHGLGVMDIDFAIEQVNDCRPSQQAGYMSKTVIDGVTGGWVLFE